MGKWAKTSKLRIQKPGELEQGGVLVGRAKKALEAKTVNFGDDGNVESEKGEGPKRKPLVPFHGQVEEKFLTNKQKRIMKRRAKSDGVINAGGKAQNELKTPAQIQKEKKNREKNKLKQDPHLRKAKKEQIKKARDAAREEKQMKYGARTKSKMLIFPDGPKKMEINWSEAEKRLQQAQLLKQRAHCSLRMRSTRVTRI